MDKKNREEKNLLIYWCYQSYKNRRKRQHEVGKKMQKSWKRESIDKKKKKEKNRQPGTWKGKKIKEETETRQRGGLK